MLGLGLGIVSVAIRRRAGGLTSSVALAIGALDTEASPAELAFTTDAIGTLFWGVAAAALIPSQLLAGEGLAAGDVLVGEDGGSASVDLSALPPGSYVLSAVMQRQSNDALSAVQTLAISIPASEVEPVIPDPAATGEFTVADGRVFKWARVLTGQTITVPAGADFRAWVRLTAGGGGYTAWRDGGGGGGGGVVEPADSILIPAGDYPVAIGAGGLLLGTPTSGFSQGQNSTFAGLTALGGGAGARNAGQSGGSGAGSAGANALTTALQPDSASGGFGHRGGNGGGSTAGGGGGGAGAIGSSGSGASGGTGGRGGPGRLSYLTGAAEYVGAGGSASGIGGTQGASVGFLGRGSGGGVDDSNVRHAGVAGELVICWTLSADKSGTPVPVGV